MNEELILLDTSVSQKLTLQRDTLSSINRGLRGVALYLDIHKRPTP
jgi:hypothetical protein